MVARSSCMIARSSWWADVRGSRADALGYCMAARCSWMVARNSCMINFAVLLALLHGQHWRTQRLLFISRHCQEWSAVCLLWADGQNTTRGSLSSELHTLSHSPGIRSQSERGETQIMKPERDVLSRRTIPVRRQANGPLFAVNCKAELPIKLNREKSHIFSLLTSIDFTYDPAELTIFSR